MMQYVLELIAFQLLFLIIYDLFLKKETFFQWNRFYLIGTYILSMVLPWVKIEAFKTDMPIVSEFNLDVIYQLDEVLLTPNTSESVVFNVWETIIGMGILTSLVLFIYKVYQIKKLRNKGEIYHLTGYTKVVVKESNIAFSFFKTIFLGDKIAAKDYSNIIKHELVHIKQKHSLDLLFFELMRILIWFNPLVYIYQKRIAELHEFIADATVAKKNKKEQYQILLSQVFQTSDISFINQFFKSSLIKKRIVMLQKSKSKKVWQLKYLLLVPLVLGMLCYTSCNSEEEVKVNGKEVSLEEKILELEREIKAKENLSEEEKMALSKMIYFSYPKDVKGISGEHGELTFKGVVPFGFVENAPVFPGCEDVEDKRACFNEKMMQHIRTHFKYPLEAQEKGIQGKAYVMFKISTNGNIEDVNIRAPHELLKNEATRIISLLPQMKPGKDKGEAIEVPFSIPIHFGLE